jgi:hypothetical protein
MFKELDYLSDFVKGCGIIFSEKKVLQAPVDIKNYCPRRTENVQDVI